MKRYTIKRATKTEVEQLPSIWRIIYSPNARQFALLETSKFTYVIAWDSDIVEPEVIYLGKYDLVIIAIDLSVVALSGGTGNILFKIGLSEFFSFILETELGFLIVSQTTIMAVNGDNCSISRFESFPDIITNCTRDGNSFIVECMNSSYRL